METSTQACQLILQKFSGLDVFNPIQIFEARYGIELTICRLCVLHAGTKDIKSLGVIVEKMENSQIKVDEFIELDLSFHCALANATKNDFLIAVSRSLHLLNNQDPWCQKGKLLLTRNEITKHQKAHRDIFTAIQSRDAELASNEMKKHVNTAREMFRDVF
jgi:GntR family transcriptional repressor for pyruvate dehydrogenase complex